MPTRDLTPQEEKILELCVDGLTNDQVASQLGLTVGTVNTEWLRIKLKVREAGLSERALETVRQRADSALREENVELSEITELIATKEKKVVELRAALALLHLAVDQIKSTVWITDHELVIQLIANGEYPSTHFGVKWDIGKTVYEIFKTTDPADIAIAAHLGGLEGKEFESRLSGEFSGMVLHVLPLMDESGEAMGCISILNRVE